ncbi:MAG: hypothetical protein KAQ98_09850 [Bacteriovoracaceae bacterium]|nr:hypothetical protein [Bacteriovoracaceae bacterium]
MQDKRGFTILEITIAIGLLGGLVFFLMSQTHHISILKKGSLSSEQEMSESRSFFYLLSTYWSKRIDNTSLSNITLSNCKNDWCTEISFPFQRKVSEPRTFSLQTSCKPHSSLPHSFSSLLINVSRIKRPGFCKKSNTPYIDIQITGKTNLNFPVVSGSLNYSPFGAFIEFKKHSSGLFVRYQTWSRTGKKSYSLKNREIGLEMSSWAGSGIVINPI